jgi:hypothetical protein
VRCFRRRDSYPVIGRRVKPDLGWFSLAAHGFVVDGLWPLSMSGLLFGDRGVWIALVRGIASSPGAHGFAANVPCC